MSTPFRAGLLVIGGVALLGAAGVLHVVMLEPMASTVALAAAGALLSALGLVGLRGELRALARRRRGEIVLYSVGVVGVLVALAYLSARYSARFDLTVTGQHSLSEATVTMLKRLHKPVRVVFFHDPLMRETVELYRLMARETARLQVEFHDPMINPAQARMLGVNFAGTAVMESEGRRLQVHSGSETDIANGILRVSQSVTQRVCFLDGHGEPDPFSLESHDHLEGSPGHSHGLGARYVLHERHGMAKARHALETLNYGVEKLLLLKETTALTGCVVLVVPGPKTALLPREVAAIREYLSAGGSAFFMLDPFVQTALEPVIREYGVVVDETLVIDEASHFWADLSAPAVSDYNRHQITRQLPLTFFPGARSLSPTPQRVPGTSVTPLINTSRNSWGQRDPDRVSYVKGRDVPGPHTLMVVAVRRPDGESSDAVPPRGRRSRIVVVGDSDFATNSFFHIMGNGGLFLNVVNYLAAQEDLIGLQPRTADLPRINLTNRQMKATFVLSVLLVPALLTLVGTVVWWRQH